MKFIVAVDEAWNIGYEGNLLTYVPEDLQYFKKTTEGHVVVMGRKTYESLKNKKPLPNRRNIILTRDPNLKVDGFEVVHQPEDILALEQQLKSNCGENQELFIIGGAQIYELFLPYCQEAYVTKLEGTYKADTTLFNLDEIEAWKLVEKSPLQESKRGVKFYFNRYKKDEREG